MGLIAAFKQGLELRRFKRLPAEARSIVVYAEDANSWPHLGPLVEAITKTHDLTVCYLTSSHEDPIWRSPPPNVLSFWIGDRGVRTWFFMTLEAKVLVMTMPDIETFQIKRSRVAKVHYVYAFHSLVSSHMIYRTGAFDHFDTILCAGPHHVAEIRAKETVYGLPHKRLVEYGFPKLDTMMAARDEHGLLEFSHSDRRTRVLVAPSWGPQGLIETRGRDVVAALLEAGFHVTVRPHPMTRRCQPESLERLDEFKDHEAFELSETLSSQKVMHDADVLISDWSGAALEFAFGLERPVVFVDVPRKINNPEYEKTGLIPVEVSLRTEVGAIVPPDDPKALVECAKKLCEDPASFRARLRDLRKRTVFYPGRSAEVGARIVCELAGSTSGK